MKLAKTKTSMKLANKTTTIKLENNNNYEVSHKKKYEVSQNEYEVSQINNY